MPSTAQQESRRTNEPWRPLETVEVIRSAGVLGYWVRSNTRGGIDKMTTLGSGRSTMRTMWSNVAKGWSMKTRSWHVPERGSDR